MKYIKNIGNKLRIKYPTLWNLNIIPTLSYSIILISIVFIIIYDRSKLTTYYEKSHYYSPEFLESDQGAILLLCCNIFALIISIGWFIKYNKHNEIRNFYPINLRKFYLSFLGITLISAVLCSIPFIIHEAEYLKYKHSATEIDDKKDQETIVKFNVLTNIFQIYEYLDNRYTESQYEVNKAIQLKDEYDSIPSYKYYNDENLTRLDENLINLGKIMEEEVIQIKAKTKQEILNRNEAYITSLINDFSHLYNKLNKTERAIIYADSLSKTIVNDPNLRFQNIYQYLNLSDEHKSEYENYRNSRNYVDYNNELHHFTEYINNIFKAKRQPVDFEDIYITLFNAIIASILIVLFRLTNLKTILLSALYTLLVIIFLSLIFSITTSDNSILTMRITILVAGICIPLYFLIKSFRKKEKGIISSISLCIFIAGILTLPIPFFKELPFDSIGIIYLYIIILMLPLCKLMLSWKALPNK